jgi:hypothetical protein
VGEQEVVAVAGGEAVGLGRQQRVERAQVQVGQHRGDRLTHRQAPVAACDAVARTQARPHDVDDQRVQRRAEVVLEHRPHG